MMMYVKRIVFTKEFKYYIKFVLFQKSNIFISCKPLWFFFSKKGKSKGEVSKMFVDPVINFSADIRKKVTLFHTQSKNRTED